MAPIVKPLRILCVGSFYAPERTAIGPYTAQLAAYLGARGHRVHVSTAFPHFPEWRFHDGYRAGLYRRERRGNVVVRRSRHVLPRTPDSVGGRLICDGSFAAGAVLTGALAGPVDVVLAVSPPLTAALAAAALARLWRAPLILWLQDLTVDVALTLGLMRRDSPSYRAAAAIERYLERNAQAIVVIGEAFKEHLVEHGAPADKVILQHNWIDTDIVRPTPERHFRARHGFRERDRVIIHAGNMGIKQGLENVLLAADRLRHDPNLHIVLVGEGSAKEALRWQASELGLPNVMFLPFHPAWALSDMLSSGDLLLVNQRGAIGNGVLASKLLTYMAVERPVIAAAHPDSATARALRASGAGLQVPPDDPAALADGISRALADPVRSTEWARNGRAWVKTHGSSADALEQFSGLIEGVARGTMPPEPAPATNDRRPPRRSPVAGRRS